MYLQGEFDPQKTKKEGECNYEEKEFARFVFAFDRGFVIRLRSNRTRRNNRSNNFINRSNNNAR